MEAADDPFSCFGSSSSSDDEDDDDDYDRSEEEEEVGGGGAGAVATATDLTRRLVDEANARRSAASAVEPLLPIDSPDDYEVFDGGPLRGKGLRALRQCAAGDEILRETAAMRVLNSHAASSREEAEGMHAAAVKDEFDSLPEVTRRAVLELSSCGKWNDADDAGGGGGGKVTPLGAYQTNSFRLEGGGGGGDGDGDGGGNNPDAAYGGLFLTIARINHSCRPNVCHMWRPDLRKMIVFACRDIAPGDEICTTYGPSECLDTEGRRAHLLEHFSFECTCDMCTEGNSNGGDDRMTELNSLQEDIAFLTASGKPQAAIRAVERCLSLLEEQGIGSGAFVKPILHYGYMISVAGLRDGAMARSYLVRELVAVKKCEGEDSPSALKIQQELDDMAA